MRLATVLAILVPLLATGLAAAAVSEEEARRVFEELRCNSCHVSGGVAPSWEEMVRIIGGEWPQRYGSIDEAARDVSYMGQRMFNDFTHLMKVMGDAVGAPEDKVRVLEEFFRSLFEEGKAGATPTGTPAQATPAGAAPGDRGGELAVVVAAAVAVAVVVGVLVLLATRRR